MKTAGQILEFLAEGADLDSMPLASPDTLKIEGAIKTIPEDFVVEEIPAYEFSGEGDHVLLLVQKKNIAGGDMLRALAAAAGVRQEEIGTAGTKDRRAVTRQWVSIPARGANPGMTDDPDWPGVPGITILERTSHTNKLKPGHLRGNRFRILVRGVDPDALPMLEKAAEKVAIAGFPNLFGTQRFGRNGESLLMGLGVMGVDPKAPGGRHGRRIGGFERRMAVSSVQSALFNLWVKARFEDGLDRTVLKGDIMARVATGGMFQSEDTETDLQRLNDGEIEITGPMFGTKMMAAGHDAEVRETSLLEAAGLDSRNFGAAGKLAEGTRRDMIVVPDSMTVEAADDGIVFSFALPKGSYASVLMREFVKDTRCI